MKSLLDAVAEAISKHRLLEPADRVLVGLSGGPDSLVLLTALRRLGYEVAAAHLDHGWRPESAGEAARVAERCAEWGVRCHLGRASEDRPATEAAGREARFDFFNALAAAHGYTAIALGHHADDQCETVLFRLARGAGPGGLAGMRPRRGQAAGPPIVRPMLEIPRACVHEALEAWGLLALEDPGNALVDRARNRLRHEALPALKAVNSQAMRHVAAACEVLADEDALQEESARRLAKFMVRAIAPGLGELDRRALLALSAAQQRRVLRHAGRAFGGSAWDSDQLEAALGVAVRGGAADLGKHWHVACVDDVIVFGGPAAGPPAARFVPDGLQPTAAWGWAVTVGPIGPGPASPVRVRFDASALHTGLVWRSPGPDDTFRPWGHARVRSLRHHLSAAGVSPHRQRAMLVLAEGSDVWWVVGLRRGAEAHVQTPEESREMQAFACFEV